jgi:hypothetical protein
LLLSVVAVVEPDANNLLRPLDRKHALTLTDMSEGQSLVTKLQRRRRGRWRAAESTPTVAGMARRPRKLLDDGVFQVTAKGVAEAMIFLDDTDRSFFVWQLREVIERFDWSCLAYCLMGTHENLLSGSRVLIL